eukprot:scpid43073/ scgid2345/ 
MATIGVLVLLLIACEVCTTGAAWAKCFAIARDMQFIRSRTSWLSAEQDCQRRGGHLATLRRNAEFTCANIALVLNSTCQDGSCGLIWVGLNQLNSLQSYHWIGNHNSAQSVAGGATSVWGPGQPSSDQERCVGWLPTLKLADQECSHPNGYICERPQQTSATAATVSRLCQGRTYTYHSIAGSYQDAQASCQASGRALVRNTDPIQCVQDLFGDTRLTDARLLSYWTSCGTNGAASECATTLDTSGVVWTVLLQGKSTTSGSHPRPFICRDADPTTPTISVTSQPSTTSTSPATTATSPVQAVATSRDTDEITATSPVQGVATSRDTDEITATSPVQGVATSRDTDEITTTAGTSRIPVRTTPRVTGTISTTAPHPTLVATATSPDDISTTSGEEKYVSNPATSQNIPGSTKSKTTQNMPKESGTSAVTTEVTRPQTVQQEEVAGDSTTGIVIGAVLGCAFLVLLGILLVCFLRLREGLINFPMRNKSASVSSIESNHAFRPDPCRVLVHTPSTKKIKATPEPAGLYENVKQKKPEYEDEEVQYAVIEPIKDRSEDAIRGKKEPPTDYAELQHNIVELCRSVSR